MTKAFLLNRMRLNNLLSSIDRYPLTLVVAPVGFGKTTAVRGFFQSRRQRPLWVAFLHPAESISFFWEKFTAELEKLSPNGAARLKALGFPCNVPQYEKVVGILNGIQTKKKIALVVDDLQLCSDPVVCRFLMQLVMEKIENFRLIIITRSTSNLDYAEPLSKGLCQVISQQNLKFTEEEVTEYCRLAGDWITEADIRKINSYTDGWISLIYLVLTGLENGIPVGMNDSIDELVEKVLFNVFDDRIKNFLFMLSVMDVFTVEQAVFITREETSHEILKRLHKENAFVYYDPISKCYKIHNVFLDYLRIRRPFTEETLRMLYRRLGEWHLQKNELPISYAYFNRAGDAEQILSLLNDPRNIRNELTIFEGSEELFRKLPQEMLDRYPIAYMQHILLSIVEGDEKSIPVFARKLENLQKVYEELTEIDEAYRNRVLAEILIIRKFVIFNHLDSGDEYNQNILRLLNGKQSWIMRRDNEFTFGSPHLLYLYFRDPGTLKSIAERGAVSFTSYSRFADGCGTGSDYLLVAEYALETGDWAGAESNSRRAVYKAETKAQTSIMICADFTLIRLFILQGKIREALHMLKELEAEVLALDNPYYNTTIDMCKGYVYACLGQPERVPYWLQTGDMTEADLLYQGVAFNYIVYGKSLMASGNYIALEVLAESAKEYFGTFSNQLGFIHNGIFEAVAKYRLYGLKEGLAPLRRVLADAQADGIVMPFAENAPHLTDMLNAIADTDMKNKYFRKVVSCCEQYLSSLRSNQVKKIKLSPREAEVLSLAADGLTRKEIASRLMVSQGTVKTHLQNIYQKLEVSGKTTAIKIARMYGLI